jgi:HEAT repeat protein
MHAALALGSVGGPEAVDALVGALDDEDANVRFHVIEALGRLGAADAVTPLSRVAASGDFFLAFPAIDALAKIDDPEVLPVLVSLLDQEELQPAVVDALSALGDEDCVPALAGLINDGRGDVAAICATLERIAERYDKTIGDGALIADGVRQTINSDGVARICAGVQARREPLRGLVVVAGWCGKAALPWLLSVLDAQDVQSEASTAIVRIGRDAVPALVECMRTGSRDTRLAAARLLGGIGDRRATAVLADTVASHDSEIVSAAVGALADIGDAEALDALLELFSHPDLMVRHSALAAVQSLGDPRLGTYAREALTSSDSRVRESALRIAGYFGFQDCVAGIIDALTDPVEDVRRAAIEQLPLVDDSRSATLLVAALQSDSARNRAAAAHALRSIEAPGVEAALIAALGDADAWVRYFAAGSLETHAAGADAVSALARLAIADAAPHVRIAAVGALTTLSPASLSDIVPHMVDDPDENVAAAAINALPYLEAAAVDARLDGALHGTNPTLQLAAAAALTRCATPHAVTSLAWAAQLGEPAELTSLAIKGLRTIATSGAPDAARAAVDALVVLGGDALQRDAVTEALAELGPTAIGWLRDAYSTAGAAGRVVLVHVWARLRHPDASLLVVDALRDPAPQVRMAAVLALGRIGSSIARTQVVTLASADPRPAVRRAAASVCRRLSWELLVTTDDGLE